MNSLIEDLQIPVNDLKGFQKITKRVLGYLPNVISNRNQVKGYSIYLSNIAGTTKYTRPVNDALFISNTEDFDKTFDLFLKIVCGAKENRGRANQDEAFVIDKVIYTIQQSIGVGLDLLSNPNSARKHVGNRFEELIKLVLTECGVTNKKIVFKIPYPTENGEKMYSCETDLILSPYQKVKSTKKSIDKGEVILSLKTSSKDRMGKIFLDKLLMRKFASHEVKVVGVFLNDVQRKEASDISYTSVSGLFMVYTQFLTELDGVYFVDPPPKTKENPYKEHISPLSRFILKDVWSILSP